MVNCRICQYRRPCRSNDTDISSNMVGCANFKPFTNGGLIRDMSDKEMSTQLFPLLLEVFEDGVPTEEEFLNWLKSEAKE